MNGGRLDSFGRRAAVVVLALAMVLAGGLLAGCGSDSSNVESSAKKQIEAGTKMAEEGLQQGTKEAEEAIQEAKKEVKGGQGAKQFKEGLKQAEEGVQQGKAQGEEEIEEVKKQIEEANE
jgi:hypothetical protein